MSSVDNPYFIVVNQSDSLLSWKQNKTSSVIPIGLLIIFFSLCPFLLGAAFILSSFTSAPLPSFGLALTISISMNVLMIFIDITFVSAFFNITEKGYRRIQSLQEISSKKLQVAFLVLFSLVFLAITGKYWFPTIILSHVLKIFGSLGLLILSFAIQFLTIVMIVMGLSIMRNGYTITIDFKSKRIERVSTGILKTTKNTLEFDELSSLLIRPSESPKLPWELVLICRDKPFQILTATKDMLTEYVNQLQNFLNLPLKIA